MKISPNHSPFSLRFLVGLFALQTALAASAEASKPAYTLFMGADIELEHERAFYRVEDVTGSFFKIMVAGKEVLVSTRDGTARMRIGKSLKLAGSPLELENLKAERDYTPARDPRRKFDRMAASASGAAAAADLSEFTLNHAQENMSGTMNNPYSTATQIATATATLDQAVRSQAQATYDMGSDLSSAGYHARQMEIELAKEDYDAMRVSMEVSSLVPLDDPYLLVIAEIHERDAKPGVLRDWVFAQKLDPIDSKPRKININQGGLPIGFELLECEVRLYNHGREVPTNLSPKRVALSRKDARQYVMIDYLSSHKDATRPATAAFGEATADLRERLAAGDFSQPFFVKVDADGNPQGAFADEACTRAIGDSYVESVLGDLLYAPALEKGKPMAGVARVRLVQLLN